MANDDVMFLASGMAFNLLLAAVPFVLLLVALSVRWLGNTPDAAADAAVAFVSRLLPTQDRIEAVQLRAAVHEVARVGVSITFWSAAGFLWFATRLSSSMRSVFLRTFAVSGERGIVHGKLFDVACAVLAAVGITVWGVLSTYLVASTSWGAGVLVQLGVRETVMGPIEYAVGRLLAFLLILMLCFAAYRLVPNRPIPSHTAWVGSLVTSLLFEVARVGFTGYVHAFAPASAYTGTIATLVIVTLWTYYASLIFIIGAVVAQGVERLRVA